MAWHEDNAPDGHDGGWAAWVTRDGYDRWGTSSMAGVSRYIGVEQFVQPWSEVVGFRTVCPCGWSGRLERIGFAPTGPIDADTLTAEALDGQASEVMEDRLHADWLEHLASLTPVMDRTVGSLTAADLGRWVVIGSRSNRVERIERVDHQVGGVTHVSFARGYGGHFAATLPCTVADEEPADGRP